MNSLFHRGHISCTCFYNNKWLTNTTHKRTRRDKTKQFGKDSSMHCEVDSHPGTVDKFVAWLHTQTHTHIPPSRPCRMLFSANPVRDFSITYYNTALPAKHTPTNICLSPASCPVRPIWTQWIPEWGLATRGSALSPEKPANSEKQNTSKHCSLFSHLDTSLKNVSISLAPLSSPSAECYKEIQSVCTVY